MNTSFIKIGNRFLNLSAVKAIKIFEDESIRIFSDVPNLETPGTYYHYDIEDAGQAQKVLDAVEKMSIKA
jgi:hypothetical protein